MDENDGMAKRTVGGAKIPLIEARTGGFVSLSNPFTTLYCFANI